MKLLNAFSLSMLPEFRGRVTVVRLTLEDVKLDFDEEPMESFVGHADTAALFANLIGRPVACRRESVTLEVGEQVWVGQYTGPRLPEGSKTLPEGASVEWLFVTIDRI
jgi:hypothetical protein